MKPFRLSVYLGATEVDPPGVDLGLAENWLEENSGTFIYCSKLLYSDGEEVR